jgi:MFS family permease
MRPQYRLAAASLCCDLALYLIMLSLPYRALDLGASSFVLGLVPLTYAGPYSLTAATAGRFSDRWPRRGPIRAGLGVAISAALALSFAQTVPTMLACVGFIGIGLGFFWPSVQAGISEFDAGADLSRDTRLINIGWSTGKGLGMLGGGLLLPVIGGEGLALAGATSWAICLAVVPAMARPGSHQESIDLDERRPAHDRQRAFVRSAWVANGIAFAVVATLNHHLPRLLREGGIESERFGAFLGLVFFTQTAVFFFIGRMKWWPYRLAPLLGIQVVLAAAVLVVMRPSGFAMLLGLAPMFGVALGFLYQSSLYYSLHAPEGRGARAGMHEATLGVFSATIPVLGGAAVRGVHLEAPFLVAAAAVLTSFALATSWMMRTRPHPPTGKDANSSALQ